MTYFRLIQLSNQVLFTKQKIYKLK